MKKTLKSGSVLAILMGIFGTLAAFADSQPDFKVEAPVDVRWTGAEDADADFGHVLTQIRAKTGLSLGAADFVLLEDRDLAQEHFQMWEQASGNTPIDGMAIRLWTRLDNHALVQVEARLQSPASADSSLSRLTVLTHGVGPKTLAGRFTSTQTMALVRRALVGSDDRQIHGVKWVDTWKDGTLVRVVRVKGSHGKHTLVIALSSRKLMSHSYEEYPQADQGPALPAGNTGEFNVPVQIFPIYEETEKQGIPQARVSSELRYLKSSVARVQADPYGALRTQHFTDDKFDPILGETESGRAQGFWSMTYVKSQAAQIRAALPTSPNSFDQGGVVLEGRYATVSLHPNASQMKGLSFVPQPSTQFKPNWVPTEADGISEMIPSGSLLGRPIASLEDAWNRPARRLPDHDPTSYLNDGFDEIQVYYAVNELFDSLRPMGFTDPELSTRPFNAFVYDPDISMRDNAFYTDDTINFTTYSPKAMNFARDNSTIWHELGHGVMDRLMGDSITLADTGGLSEGMADFVAALVIHDVKFNTPFDGDQEFRIINKTGFNLTNEVHDDGEAYGGAMHDFLEASIARFGRDGLTKVADVTMEAMRLCRNHPALTAQEWFSHMLFADEMGHAPIRNPGELKADLLAALAGRNFDLAGKDVAQYTLKNGTDEVTSRGTASRNNPLRVSLAPTDVATYHLSVSLKNSSAYQFHFPVQIRVEYKAGALQGAIHWVGKENGPQLITLQSESDVAQFDVSASGCDSINRDDGSCVDYAYVQIWNQGETDRPRAKKRFYLRVSPKSKI